MELLCCIVHFSRNCLAWPTCFTLRRRRVCTMASCSFLRSIRLSLLVSRCVYYSYRSISRSEVLAQMLTRSGRFHPNKKICFSMSDFILDLCVYYLLLPTCRSYCASGTPLRVLRQCAFAFFFGHHLSSFPAINASSASEHRNSFPRVTSPYPDRCLLPVPVFCLRFFPNLTGLLSFMLSDEMTTGSVTSSDTHKRIYT